MDKQYLLAPGPTPVPPEVLLAMASPIIHHRAPVYEKVLREVRDGLKYLFQTKNEVLIFASSGTGAMEGSVTNTLCAGDKVIVVEGGKFGERWANICQAYGVKVRVFPVEWGQAIDPALIGQALQEDPAVKAVFLQATETSTGVLYPVKEIAAIVSRYPGTIMVVDAISHLGAVELPMDEWKLDIVVAGSQKALMLPPGLAFAALSDKAWELVGKSTLPKFYFDFQKELKNIKQNQSAYTPAVSLVIGLAESLRKIRTEGLENVFARHARLAKATREAMLALGLKLYAATAYSNAVTAVVAPPGVDGQKVVKILREKHNLTIAGGQDRAKGKIFRIAHLGFVDKFDVLMGVAAVEMTLQELGYAVEMGKGVRAAMEVLIKN
ncbi:MAG: class V aminotransferase [Deltaproteobacteria bacterium RBG_19FT_COMBO_52_11]|nr:MAG: class V aminotransferase [Deltaproteobacteria bacterium RBG_19FT_COMBO_52_11]